MKRQGRIVLACALGVATVAQADTELTDSSGLEFFIQSDTTSSGSSASAAASEASYTMAVVATTSSGAGTATTTLSDSFDGYGAIIVNGTYFTDNGAGTLGCSDREVSFGTQTIDDLSVTRRVYVPDDDEFIRWLTIITNDGATAVDVDVETDNNLGSDGSTIVTDSSSGDAVATAADLWVSTGGDDSDPRLGHVLQGAGAAVGLGSISFTDTDDDTDFAYAQFSLAAGETGIIMYFVTGQPSNADAQAKAAELAGLTDNALRCLTADEGAQVKNFKIDCFEDAECDDSDVCTGTETCSAGSCVAGTALVCEAGETCDAVMGCVGGGDGGTGGTGGSSSGGGGGCTIDAASTPASGTALALMLAGLAIVIRRRRS